MCDYSEVLESYTIIDDPDMIAIESFIYSALESDVSSVNKLKTNLNKLVKAKASGNETAVKQAKEEVEENVRDVNEEAANEKDAKRKAKLKKFAKIGGIIAGTIVVAASVAAVAKKIKDNKNAVRTTDNSSIESRANEIRSEVAKRQSELADKRKDVEKTRNEILQKANRAAAEIEAKRAKMEEGRDEFKEKVQRQLAENEKIFNEAKARNELVRKVGQIASGQKNVELTEEEAKAVRNLTQSLNQGVKNLADARVRAAGHDPEKLNR